MKTNPKLEIRNAELIINLYDLLEITVSDESEILYFLLLDFARNVYQTL